MPIIRRIRPCPTACGVLPRCVGCGLVELHRDAASQDHSQPQPTHPGRTPCSRTRSYSPDDARNMLR